MTDYNEAKHKVEDLKAFYAHIITYVGVIFFLFILNLLINFTADSSTAISLDNFWFQYVAIFWGIFVLAHGILTFISIKFSISFLGKAWEEKKIEEFMKKK